MYKKQPRSAFTLAETFISIAIVAVICVLTIAGFNSASLSQKELLSRFQISYQKLNNMTEQLALASKSKENWSADTLSLSNLSCTTIANPSECLKSAYLTISNTPENLPGNASSHFQKFDDMLAQLKVIFGDSLDAESITAFQLPGNVTVGVSYLDSSCNTDIPISRSAAGAVETVKGCGFLIVDVNGKRKPNNLLIAENQPIDRFLLALTAKNLVKSDLLDEEIVNNALEGFVCPINMTFQNSIHFDNNIMYKQYPYGQNHPDCFEIKCLGGEPLEPSTLTCRGAFICPHDMSVFSAITFDETTMNKITPDAAHPDCYELTCKSGVDMDTVTGSCFTCPYDMSVFSRITYNASTMNKTVPDAAHPDCYELTCKSGAAMDATGSCFICPHNMSVFSRITYNTATMNKVVPDAAHPDCYELTCKSGLALDTTTGTCPTKVCKYKKDVSFIGGKSVFNSGHGLFSFISIIQWDGELLLNYHSGILWRTDPVNTSEVQTGFHRACLAGLDYANGQIVNGYKYTHGETKETDIRNGFTYGMFAEVCREPAN